MRGPAERLALEEQKMDDNRNKSTLVEKAEEEFERAETIEQALRRLTQRGAPSITKLDIVSRIKEIHGVFDAMVEEHSPEKHEITLVAKYNPVRISREVLDAAIEEVRWNDMPINLRLKTQLLEDSE